MKKIMLFALMICATAMLLSSTMIDSADGANPILDRDNMTVDIDGDVVVMYKDDTKITPGHFYCFDSDRDNVVVPEGVGIDAPVGIFIKEGVTVKFVFQGGSTDGNVALLVYTVSDFSDGKVILPEKSFSALMFSENRSFNKYNENDRCRYLIVIPQPMKELPRSFYSVNDYIRGIDAPAKIQLKADKEMGAVFFAEDANKTLTSGTYSLNGPYGLVDLTGSLHNLSLTGFSGTIQSMPDGSHPVCKTILTNFTGQLSTNSEGALVFSKWEGGRINVYMANIDQSYLINMAPEGSSLTFQAGVPFHLEEDQVLNKGVTYKILQSIDVLAGHKLTIDGKLMTNGNYGNYLKVAGDVIVNGELLAPHGLEISGKLINNGIWNSSEVTNTGEVITTGNCLLRLFTNDGSVINSGQMRVWSKFINNGQLINDGAGVLKFDYEIKNPGIITLKSDNGFVPSENMDESKKNAYSNLRGRVILDAPGKILGFSTDKCSVVEIMGGSSVVGGLCIFLNGPTDYGGRVLPPSLILRGIHFDRTGVFVHAESAVNLVQAWGVTIGTESQPITPCWDDAAMKPLISSMGLYQSMYDGALVLDVPSCSRVSFTAEEHVKGPENSYGNINWTCYDGTLTIRKNSSASDGSMDLSGKTFKEVFGDSVREVIICDGITTIDASIFRGSGIASLTIKGVKTISEGTFSDCTSLKELVISNGVQIIGSSAFKGCTSLSNIVLGSDVTEIGDYAFFGCGINSIILPDSTTKIGYKAFVDNPLVNVFIPKNVVTIDSSFPFTSWYDYDRTTEVVYSVDNVAGFFWGAEGMSEGSVCKRTQGELDGSDSGLSDYDGLKAVVSIAIIVFTIVAANIVTRRN